MFGSLCTCHGRPEVRRGCLAGKPTEIGEGIPCPMSLYKNKHCGISVIQLADRGTGRTIVSACFPERYEVFQWNEAATIGDASAFGG